MLICGTTLLERSILPRERDKLRAAVIVTYCIWMARFSSFIFSFMSPNCCYSC